MSKNKYSLPFREKFYVEFGGIRRKDSHSWNIISQRYAYDFEIRDEKNSPYHDDYKVIDNYYSYKHEVLCPCDGVVVEVCNKYEDTKIADKRCIVCDVDDVRSNHIIIFHGNNEYSMIAHLLKDTIKVEEGNQVKRGEVLALVGNSGNTNGPHIHFQVTKGLGDNALGVPITFKNIVMEKNNRRIIRKYIKHGMHVYNR